MKAIRILYIVMATSIFACDNEATKTNIENGTDSPETIFATIRKPETRLGFEYDEAGNTLKVGWKVNDQIRVYGTDGSGIYQATEVGDDDAEYPKTATFNYVSGTVGTPTDAFYPANKAELDNNDNIVSVLGQIQRDNDNTDHLANYVYLTGAINNPVTDYVDLKYRVAVLRFDLNIDYTISGVTTTRVKALSLHTENDEDIAVGENSSGTPTLFAKQLNMALWDSNVNTGSPIIVYMALLPSTIKSGQPLMLSLTTNEGVYEYRVELSDDFNYEPGYIYTTKVTLSANEYGNHKSSSYYWESRTSTDDTWETATGDGSESNPYIIDSPERLKSFKIKVNNSGDGYEGKYFKLGADIYIDYQNDGDQWIPIGNSTPFKGIFDGSGYTIGGVMQATGTEFNYGFFGNIDGATIKNLHIASNISASDIEVNSIFNYGGIVGSAYNAIITNCTMTGNFILYTVAPQSTNSMNIGGIVGSLSGVCEITNNQSNSNINPNGNYPVYRLGGIVGYTFGSGKISIKGNINTGNITSNSDWLVDAGGIVGWVTDDQTTISWARNTGIINAGIHSSSHAGGIVGYNWGTIHTSHNENISISASENNAGGIAGNNVGIIYSCCTSIFEPLTGNDYDIETTGDDHSGL